MGFTRVELFGKDVKCEYCGKSLRALKTRKDWDKRRLHKSCWRIKSSIDELRFEIENFRIHQFEKLENENADLKRENQSLTNSVEFFKNLSRF